MMNPASVAHFNVEPLSVIYGLHLGDHRYRYIGLTTHGTKVRLKNHLALSRRPSSRSPVHHWIRKHGTENIQIDIIEICHDHKVLAEREIFWIAHYRKMYDNMLNVTDGGEGTPGIKRNFSDEHRRKISIAKSGKNHPNYGKNLSEETRAKISAANKGQKVTPEAIERIKKINAERVWTDEYRAKLSAGKIGNTNGKRTSHVRWHINKNVSKPETCKYCKEETNDS